MTLSPDPALDYDYLTPKQYDTLLRPLNAQRIEQRIVSGQKLSYLSQQDVRSHLTRILGFARWSGETVSTELMFADPVVMRNEKEGWYCAHRVTYTLTICAPSGMPLARYTESAIAGNTQPEKHEAMDMSLKSATSDAMKRCAINLGDQFGLSLYNKGSVGAIVRGSLVQPTVDGRDGGRRDAEKAQLDARRARNDGTADEPQGEVDLTAISVPLDESDQARAEAQALAEGQIEHSMSAAASARATQAPATQAQTQAPQPSAGSWPVVAAPGGEAAVEAENAARAANWRPNGTIAEQDAAAQARITVREEAAAQALLQGELGAEVIPGA